MRAQCFGVLVILAAIAGCSKQQIPLGHNDKPGLVGASLTDYEGDWVGYAESFTWNDGSDIVRLSLSDQGDGVLAVGKTDASLPSVDLDNELPMTPDDGLVAGFSYSVSNARVTNRRIQASAASQEMYADWCASFEPVENPFTPGSFACVDVSADFTFDAETGCRSVDDPTPVPCGRVMCLRVCFCDADSCSAYVDPPDVVIDAALDDGGEALEGTLAVGESRITLRMHRAD